MVNTTGHVEGSVGLATAFRSHFAEPVGLGGGGGIPQCCHEVQHHRLRFKVILFSSVVLLYLKSSSFAKRDISDFRWQSSSVCVSPDE